MELHGGPNKRKRRKPPDPSWARFITKEDKERERIAYWESVALADSSLPVRIANTLEKHGILTVGELAQQSLARLRRISNLGEITIQRCVKLLEELKVPNRLNSHE